MTFFFIFFFGIIG